MFGMRTKTVARALEESSANYGPESAAYSPADADGMALVGLPMEASQADDPGSATSNAPDVRVPRPPSPSVGGRPGIAEGLGWTTGLRPSRAMRTKLDGKTLVVPTMGVHPAEGPVGFSTRSDRLAAGVNALVDAWLPSQQTINDDFVGARNRNPLDAD